MPKVDVIPAVDRDGDSLWFDPSGDIRYSRSGKPGEPGWRRLYVEPVKTPIDRKAVEEFAEWFEHAVQVTTDRKHAEVYEVAARKARELLT